MKEKTKKLIAYITMCIVVIGLVFYALRTNEVRKYNDMKTSYISDYLTEIKYDDLKEHLIENPTDVIYVSDSSSDESKKFEKKFKSVIKKYNLETDIVYINIYNSNINDMVYQNAPEIIIYENGSLKEVIDCNTLKDEKVIIKALKERSVIVD